MPSFRTTQCGRHGHREVTLQFARQSPIPNAERFLIDYFEGAVARGAKFAPGQRVQLGWSTLLLGQRADGTLSVQERELSPEVQWVEAVDRAVLNLWYQRELAASLGLMDELDYPRQDDGFLAAGCALDADELILSRLPDDGEFPEGFSGWTLACAEDHEHPERRVLPLLALAANHPGLVQLLGLPRATTVFVRWVAKPDAPKETRRIEPHVFRDGEELVPRPGSYLAHLQA